MKHLDFTVNANGVGVTVHDLDLAGALSADILRTVKELLNRHRLVIFENQALDDAQLCEFAHRLAPPFTSTVGNPVLGGAERLPDVVVVGNRASEYAESFLGHQEVLPHSDHQWLRCPSASSLLFAVDVEPGAASTTWTDMVAAYALLEPRMQAKIEGLQLITYNPFFRPFGSVCAKYVDRRAVLPPGPVFPHPLVRTHPDTGEKVLYLHAAYEMELAGVEYEAGRALVEELHRHMASLECVYEHHWKNGDLVLWDNQATVHYRPPFGAEVRRVLKRVSMAGGIPY